MWGRLARARHGGGGAASAFAEAGGLLANAAKFGEGNPITLEVSAHGDRARIRVTDRGIGIAQEHLARVFERFERAVPSHRFGGLGLGLYIVRQIAEAHGGEVRVESTPGSGAVFTVDLPREPPAVAGEEAGRLDRRRSR